MRKTTPLFILAGFLLALAPASAQRCENVKIRLWVDKEAEEFTWHARGETLQIPAGEWARIMVYVEGKGSVPSTTQAQVGYADDVGLSGGPGPRQVREVVNISPQSRGDRAEGRITLDAVAVGTTELAYRIEGVSAPDSLDAVAEACRSGRIPLRVTPAVGEPAGPAAGLDPRIADQATRKCQNTMRNRITEERRRTAAAEPGGVTLYQAGDYRGRSQTFVRDQAHLSGTEIGNDRVSSIRVAPGCRATLYTGGDFSGKAIEVTRDTPAFSRLGINDQVSSLRVECEPVGSEVEEVEFTDAVEARHAGEHLVEVRGTARVSSATRWDRYDYECTYDLRSEEIATVDYSLEEVDRDHSVDHDHSVEE